MNKPLLDLFHKRVAQTVEYSQNPTADLIEAARLIQNVIDKVRNEQMGTQQAQVQGDAGSVTVSGSQIPESLQQAKQICVDASGQIGSLLAAQTDTGQPVGGTI